MGILNEGAGERTERTRAEGVRANEDLRQQNRTAASAREFQHNKAMADYKSALKQYEQWDAENLRWKHGQVRLEQMAALKQGRAPRFTHPSEVADMGERPAKPIEPVLAPIVTPKVPMSMGVFGLIVAAILIGWATVGDFVVNAYIVGVFAVPVGYAALVSFWFWKIKKAEGDPGKLASLDRWNPLRWGLNVVFWCGRMLWKLVMLGLRKL
jgi:hypothetical protein